MTRPPIAVVLALALCGCGPRGPAETPADEIGCSTDEDCGPADQCRDGVCAPYEGQLGDPCYDDMDCALELSCEGGDCIEPRPD